MTMTSTILTVAGIRELLEQYDGDMPVMFGAKSGDYWGTVTASAVGYAETSLVEWSDYHDTYVVSDQVSDEGCMWAVVVSR